MEPARDVVIADRFRLNFPLGHGSMGSVWNATHLGLDVPCAVKLMGPTYAGNTEFLARFEREAKSAARLHSSHVVQILDYGIFDGVPYIAMELLEGEDLGQRLARLGRVAPVDMMRITCEVAQALTRAHAAGVVHRDLKPENVFLEREGDGEVVKVVDFGLAKAPTSRVTRVGEVLGTPYYMSPEQVRGSASVDARSDLWSLGVIVFRCLTGQLPFDGGALVELLVKITTGPIPAPSVIAPDLPGRFDLWWARASQRDPRARFQSATDMEMSLALAFAPPPLERRSADVTLVGY